MTSVGFGQKGSQAILVHPRYLFATIYKEKYNEYSQKREQRCQRVSQVYATALVNEDMVSACIKDDTPYPDDGEMEALLNPFLRY